MSTWTAKKFWTQATVVQDGAGFVILLDERPVKTPAKAAFTVPTLSLAQAIAAEWDAQSEVIDPTTMPYTRSANAAIDKVATQHSEVADMIAAYGDSDLLCYRADSPEGLVERQSQAWDPLLDWAASDLDARLEARAGVMHVPQSEAALARLSAQTHALDAFQLAAFHDLVSLSGSLVIGFAATHRIQTGDSLWEVSRVDENWQRDQWGADEEADAAADVKKEAFLHALRFYNHVTGNLPIS